MDQNISASSQKLPSEKAPLQELQTDINEFVKYLLADYSPVKVSAPKIIHDPILGSNLFQPYEIALIDTPLCQRLRYVTQTDVASIVYPSANHSRLEHSIGVATIAGRMAESIRRQESNEQHKVVSPEAEIEVRMAAILHDVGHGVFSHLSEEVYGQFPEISDFRRQYPGRYDPDKPHEILSHLIIKSPAFKQFFEEYIVKGYNLDKGKTPPNIERIADLVTSGGRKGSSNTWQGHIINGPFDADKFDYLLRDSYFSGLKIGIDLDRFLHCIWVDMKAGSNESLKVKKSGAITVEQICFGKLVLYNSVYHHQKIRAAESILKGILNLIVKYGQNGHSFNNRKMKRAIDFLYLNEHDILSLNDKPDEIKKSIQRFINRNLLKRALVISTDTVLDPMCEGYRKFRILEETPQKLNELNSEFLKYCGGEYCCGDIYIDIPRTVTFGDSSQADIQDPGDDKPQPLRDYFRIEEWSTAYSTYKWKGHVFCLPNEEARKVVGNKFVEFIGNHKEYKYSLNMEKARSSAKIR